MKLRSWVHADRSFVDQQYSYKIYPFNTAVAGSVVVCEIEVEVEIPANFNPAEKEKESRVQALKARIQEAKTTLTYLEQQLEDM